MKTNRTTQQKRAGKKRQKKAMAHPFTEIEGNPYNGLPNQQTFSLGKSTWKENRRNAKAWDIEFETIAIKSFEGDSTLPIGSVHHNYVLAHQTITKTRKNTYQFKMKGIKFKLAHKEADSKWNCNSLSQKNALIKILKETLHELEMGHGRAPSDSKKAPTDLH